MKNGLLPRQKQEPFTPNSFYTSNSLRQTDLSTETCCRTKQLYTIAPKSTQKTDGKKMLLRCVGSNSVLWSSFPQPQPPANPIFSRYDLTGTFPTSHQLDAPDLGQAHRKAHIEGSSSSQCEKRTLPWHRVHLPSLLTWKKRSSTQVLPQIQQQSKEAYFHILWYEFSTSTSHVCHLHLSKWKRNLFEVYFANRKRGKAGDGRRLPLLQTSANYASEITP